ncbi:MAG TPA: SUF system NifU family Fe-S cluster assembly protein [Burkholderiaceae bacterium]|nr:SUF system NifU family Fe-S cluster assembly protein [Burkholderiaceae bacterium]HSB98357.1 SUF system NifU family Fe-S cluster assembly protein [Burkholderiaceae bacterium]
MNAVDAGNELYRELVLEHKRAPRNFGALDAATHRAQGHNPQCGDDVRVELRVEGGRLADIRFAGQGCAICIASASMMTEAVKGRAIAEAEQLQQRFRAVLTGQLDPESAVLGKLESLAGVRRYPARIKCALLGWHALMHALANVEAPADAPERPQGRASPDRPSARVGQSGKSALA